ncbi:DsbA family oxidoreductase [Lysobacter sp. TAF61]|uniref:DsbA family oxidoreductase n=1 Tax=Lysobacter sp. TAF61 TaxID=3233072 RepID=UPI003F96B5E2
MNNSSKVAVVSGASHGIDGPLGGEVMRRKLHLQVVIDLICPWCFIGKRSLDQALVRLAAQGVDIEIDWLPYLLNPDLPDEGMDRKQFRSKRFGWETALAMDARAVEAGKRVGANFDYGKQTRTSNTVTAHALVRLAREEGGAGQQERLVDALFVAYFELGQDIGDHAVLARIAHAVGLREEAVQRAISARDTVRGLAADVLGTGLTGVPSYLVDGKLLWSGSQDVTGYVQRLLRAADVAGS